MNIHTITKAARNCFHHVLAHGKALILLAAIACGFLYGGCEKWDTNEGLIEIRSEAMAASHTKVSLDGASATWIDGDSIRINGEDVVVVR